MLLLLLPALTFPQARAEKVPEIVLGPNAGDAALIVEARIAEVTVFSDRARVRRRGRAAMKTGGIGATGPDSAAGAGIHVVRFPDLPGAVFLDTVRVATTGARVLRVEAKPVERERLSIAQASKLLTDLDTVNDRIVELDDRCRTDEWEVALLGRLTPAPGVPEDKREGRKNLSVDVPSWWKALDFTGQRATGARMRLVKLQDERRGLGAERERLLADIDKLNRGGFSDRGVEVIAVLELPRANVAGVDLELEYFIPGARWKPAYDLHFASALGRLRVETAAVVDQATGEDWEQAALVLSTAMPGRGIDLPELLTWTLGERSEFVPQLRPRRAPFVEPRLPGPSAAPIAGSARAVDVEIVRMRLAQAAGEARNQAQTMSFGTTAGMKPGRPAHEDLDSLPEAAENAPGVASRLAKSRPMPAPMPLSAAPAIASVAPVRAMAAFEESELNEAVTVRPRAKREKSASSGPSVVSVPLALFDAAASRQGQTLSDPFLPAVSAGGLDYVYQAPTPATIPSSGKQIRIPLGSQSFRAAAFYEATPALAATAFLRARVRNDGKRPLLRGPAAIFGDGEFVGQGEIQTTGPGGDIDFPLGADQDVRLVRQVVPTTKTTGLIMKSDETTYDVQIQIGNYKKHNVTVEILDQIPRSRRDKLEVKLLDTQPAPVGPPDADGVLRWRLEVPAGTTRTIKLGYRIVRPKGWRLFQN